MIRKRLAAKVIAFVGGACILFFTLILFLPLMIANLNDLNIIKNGKKEIGYANIVEATNLLNYNGLYYGDANEPLYFISFSFKDDNGNTINSRSEFLYTRAQINELEFVKENVGVHFEMPVQISRIGDKAFLTFENFYSPFATQITILLLCFGLSLLILSALYLTDTVGEGRIHKKGKRGTGTYVGSVKGGVIKGIRYYNLVFSFKNGNELFETKSGLFTRGEADNLQLLGNFPIKYSGRNAVVDMTVWGISKAAAAHIEAMKAAEKTDSENNDRIERQQVISQFLTETLQLSPSDAENYATKLEKDMSEKNI